MALDAAAERARDQLPAEADAEQRASGVDGLGDPVEFRANAGQVVVIGAHDAAENGGAGIGVRDPPATHRRRPAQQYSTA